MNDVLRIKRVVGQPIFGGCKPVWVQANNNKEYLLKFRYDDTEMDISNFNEYLSYRITDILGYDISPQGIKFIEISANDIKLFEKANIDIYSKKFAKKSLGINIGIEKIQHAQKVDNIVNSAFRKKVANIDNYMINCDRNKGNSNILFNKQSGRYHAIDYGLALLSHRIYEKIKNGEDLSKYSMQLQNCNITQDEYYILKNESKLVIKKTFKEVLNIIISIINECPASWEPLKFKEKIADIIATRMLNQKLFEKSKCPGELY